MVDMVNSSYDLNSHLIRDCDRYLPRNDDEIEVMINDNSINHLNK